MGDTLTTRHRQLLLWRTRTTGAILPLLACLVALFSMRGEGLVYSLLGTVALASLILFAVFAAQTLTALHSFALEVGGQRYAFAQTALAACLAPVLGIGVVLIPLLVENDARKGVAEWHQANHPPLERSLVETIVVIGIFAVILRIPYFF